MKLLSNASKNLIKYRNTVTYRKFIMVPAILVKLLCITIIGYLALIPTLYMGSLTLLSYLIHLALMIWFGAGLYSADRFLVSALAGERLWSWGKTRFATRSLLRKWVRNMSPEELEQVISVDEQMDGCSTAIKLMRP